MTVRLEASDAVSFAHGVKGMIYGRSGAGKTWLARTLPSPVVISAESGLMALRDVRLPVIKVNGVEQLTEAYEWAARSNEARQFQSIYIDSISEIGEIVLANAKRQVKDPRQAYGELIDKMLLTIKAFRDLVGFHVFMSAKQETYKDEFSGVTITGPSMPGSKLGPQLPYLFDEVFRLGINKTAKGEEYRFFQTKLDLQYEAKDRSGSLLPAETPDLGFVIRKILGK